MHSYTPSSMVLKSIRQIHNQEIRLRGKLEIEEISQMFTKESHFEPIQSAKHRQRHPRTEPIEDVRNSLFSRYVELGVARSRESAAENVNHRLNSKSKSLNIKNVNDQKGKGKMFFVNNSIKFRQDQLKSPTHNLNDVKVNTSFFFKYDKNPFKETGSRKQVKNTAPSQSSPERASTQLPTISTISNDKSVKKMPIFGIKSAMADRLESFKRSKNMKNLSNMKKEISLEMETKPVHFGPWATEFQQSIDYI